MPDQATQLRQLIEAGRLADQDALPAVLPPSVPNGSISFRPRPAVEPTPPASNLPKAKLARSIAIASGKGGVGKSNLALNLAVAMSKHGKKVCLLDADLGMANIDIMCNLNPRKTLQHLLIGRAKLKEIMLLAPGGFRLIPGASGVAGMANLGPRQRAMVMEQLRIVEQSADLILIDCAAGIHTNVLAFASAADDVVITTTNEPTAVTDAYGLIKSLHHAQPKMAMHLAVNMVGSPEEGIRVFERMNRVTNSFLNRRVQFAGAIPFDYAVPASVHHRLPFSLLEPDGSATRAVASMAERLLGLERAVEQNAGRFGFFSRVSHWFGRNQRESHRPLNGALNGVC